MCIQARRHAVRVVVSARGLRAPCVARGICLGRQSGAYGAQEQRKASEVHTVPIQCSATLMPSLGRSCLTSTHAPPPISRHPQRCHANECLARGDRRRDPALQAIFALPILPNLPRIVCLRRRHEPSAFATEWHCALQMRQAQRKRLACAAHPSPAPGAQIYAETGLIPTV